MTREFNHGHPEDFTLPEIVDRPSSSIVAAATITVRRCAEDDTDAETLLAMLGLKAVG